MALGGGVSAFPEERRCSHAVQGLRLSGERAEG
jgi:hypothetical protein